MSENRLKKISELGQSLWCDYIERNMVLEGELAHLIEADHIVGVTSNPSIFQQAIANSEAYDAQIHRIVTESPTIPVKELYEAVAIEDIQHATDLLHPIYEQTNGRDGYVSLEVSPDLAHDTEGTIAEAKQLFETVGRPNVMIKVPATPAGLPAITELIGTGINVNVTLLFSVQNYVAVAQAYLDGLEKLAAEGQNLKKVASVASFFVSRLDVLLDPQLADIPEAEKFQGQMAIANAKTAYKKFLEIFGSDQFKKLAERGAQVQRLLWASTSTKNPAYRDVMYVEELIGQDTVNTLPLATLEKFKDHGEARASIAEGLDEAESRLNRLKEFGLDYEAATEKLQEDGIAAFVQSFKELLATLEDKREDIVSLQVSPMTMDLGNYQNLADIRLKSWKAAQVAQRIWQKDGSVWIADPQNLAQTEELTNRLGWLEVNLNIIDLLESFATEIKQADFQQVVLLGMGGSSLAADVLRQTFDSPFLVLDSTNPDQVSAITTQIEDISRTLFIVSSKSGTTLETLSLFKHFYHLVEKDNPGENFIAITDPASPLETMAQEKGFRKTFLAPADVGGRYSALTYFGLVPATLIGIDIGKLLRRANSMATACQNQALQNPGLQLGAALGELALAGRNKVTFLASPQISTFPMWAEQLIAESLGKNGMTVLPVVDEEMIEPIFYNNDRCFIYLRLEGDDNVQLDGQANLLQAAGHPVITIQMDELEDLGQEFFRWEMAVAAAGAVLKINPFDQPNVELSKTKSRELMTRFEEEGSLPLELPTLDYDDIDVYGPAMGETVSTAMQAFLGQYQPGDYIAIMAYLPYDEETNAALSELRQQIKNGLRAATTLGYGPRFLHSTGQLHKGDSNRGLFIQITPTPATDIEIPGEKYTFATLLAAQAQGDYQALAERGRRLIRFHIEPNQDVPTAIRKLIPK